MNSTLGFSPYCCNYSRLINGYPWDYSASFATPCCRYTEQGYGMQHTVNANHSFRSDGYSQSSMAHEYYGHNHNSVQHVPLYHGTVHHIPHHPMHYNILCGQATPFCEAYSPSCGSHCTGAVLPTQKTDSNSDEDSSTENQRVNKSTTTNVDTQANAKTFSNREVGQNNLDNKEVENWDNEDDINSKDQISVEHQSSLNNVSLNLSRRLHDVKPFTSIQPSTAPKTPLSRINDLSNYFKLFEEFKKEYARK